MQCDYCGGPHGYSAEADWNWPRTIYLCILCRQAGITVGQAAQRREEDAHADRMARAKYQLPLGW